MPDQTIIWTVLPNGVAPGGPRGGRRLRLSVFVSPRLTPDGPGKMSELSQFPDFLDWPRVVGGAGFRVQLSAAGLPPVSAHIRQGDAERLREGSTLWKAIFRPNTEIGLHSGNERPRRHVVRSFSAPNIDTHVRAIYQAVAVHHPERLPVFDLGGSRPDGPGLPGLLHDISRIPEIADGIEAAVERQRRARRPQQGRIQAVPQPPPVTCIAPGITRPSQQVPSFWLSAVRDPKGLAGVDFAQAHDFFRRPAAPRASGGTRMPRFKGAGRMPERSVGKRQGPPPTPPEPEFHGILASLSQYPAIMRHLGLVIDLEFVIPERIHGSVWVKVVPDWSPKLKSSANVTPKTRCAIAPKGFRSLARSASQSDHEDGMLRLDNEQRFAVGQTDIDGAALKLAGYALNQRRRDESADGGIPTLRGAGIWIARKQRAAVLETEQQRRDATQQAIRAARSPGSPDPELYADDLIRGYRIDVQEAQGGPWRSLCRRVGRYEFKTVNAPIVVEDEGWVSMSATKAVDDPYEDLYLHEVMFRWEGWSLSAPRPGQAIPPLRNAPAQPQGYGLRTSFVPAAGSLPRLRFGREYRLRARVVDLAGNSLSWEADDEEHATRFVRYMRHEPVPSPVVVPRRSLVGPPPSAGEKVDCLVVRTGHRFPRRDKQDVSERHLVAPRTSQYMAELHGTFDGPAGLRDDDDVYDLFTTRDNDLADYVASEQVALPYLPDPAAIGVAIHFDELEEARGLAEGRRTVFMPFPGQWPNRGSLRIVAAKRGAPGVPSLAQQVDATTGQVRGNVLVIPLAPAEIAEIRVACYTSEQVISKMAAWGSTVDGLIDPHLNGAQQQSAAAQSIAAAKAKLLSDGQVTQADRAQLPGQPALLGAFDRAWQIFQGARLGRNWLMTPWRPLTLVHAVQRPLQRPRFRKMAYQRDPGDTFATIDAECMAHAPSSGKLDLEATWSEIVDDPAEPEWDTRRGHAHVCQVQVPQGRSTVPLTVPTAEQGSLRGPRRLKRTAKALPTHEFGDTKYRKVHYTIKATTRFQEHFSFAQQAIRDGEAQITVASDSPKAVEIRSSARPAAPKLQFVVPTFKWERESDGGQTTSARLGGGLRVYLERPWFSSGEGELLAVVLMKDGERPTEQAKLFVSQWGKDPIWAALIPDPAVMPPPPTMTLHPVRPLQLSDLSEEKLKGSAYLPELGLQRVDLVAYEVHYDTDRRLWYADVQVAPGHSYFPFVRLALARFQPKSLVRVRRAGNQTVVHHDLRLSRVVLADLAQIAPDRVATVVPDARSDQAVNVTVTGSAFPSDMPSRPQVGTHVPGCEIEVSVEQRMSGGRDELGWRAASGRPVALRKQIGENVWQGVVTLPARRGSRPFRLLIQEYELFSKSDSEKRRLVYADAIEV